MTIPTTKPTILIITGAFHVPEGYAKLTAALEEAGYEVHVPRLPSNNGKRPPNADLADDTALIRSYASSLIRAGRHVLVIAHSYGGQVCSNSLCGLSVDARAARGLKGGVSQLIYMTAGAMVEGKSMITWVEKFGHMDLMPVVFSFADNEDGSGIIRDARLAFVGSYPDEMEAEVDEYVKTLVYYNGKSMHDKIDHASWREIPVAYILTKNDVVLPLDYQKAWVEEMESAGRHVQTFELDTAHAPHLTATEDVVGIVNKVALQQRD
ncbi:hypothetical protein N0V93_001800 [Gnomoniopsis smithogilvyi]|uniref:AB hydrolase-1 domain-containing protein n=1 Tax=Gnomoniopsis smithogilvyi TaxID=1191159 RepID=A0A9W8Z2Q3_9PEZI|nr:hypothetical protein N0V93_001800 [Gnomoniopsis smithogilvyi]